MEREKIGFLSYTHEDSQMHYHRPQQPRTNIPVIIFNLEHGKKENHLTWDVDVRMKHMIENSVRAYVMMVYIFIDAIWFGT